MDVEGVRLATPIARQSTSTADDEEPSHSQCMRAVWVDGGRLAMPEGENEQEHRWQGEDSKSFNMVWQLYRPGYGNAVELTTGAQSCPEYSKSQACVCVWVS